MQRTKVPPRGNLELDALVEILEGKRLVHSHSYRQDEILMLTRVAEDFGFTIATFQHVLEGYKVADRLKEHGANASGRPFTGDHAGRLLYETLHRYGLSSTSVSISNCDRLRLFDCRITNAVKCLPPGNKPVAAEVNRCVRFLEPELFSVPSGGVVLALGKLAHDAIVRVFGLTPSRMQFGHGVRHKLPGNRTLLSSYHCSRYNTQTGRLTVPMFRSVVRNAKVLSGAVTR